MTLENFFNKKKEARGKSPILKVELKKWNNNSQKWKGTAEALVKFFLGHKGKKLEKKSKNIV